MSAHTLTRSHARIRALLVASVFVASSVDAACLPSGVDSITNDVSGNASLPAPSAATSVGWYYADANGVSTLVYTGGDISGYSGQVISQSDSSFAGMSSAQGNEPETPNTSGSEITACDPGTSPPVLPPVTAYGRVPPSGMRRVLYIRIPDLVGGGIGRNVSATIKVNSNDVSCSDELWVRGDMARHLANIKKPGGYALRRGTIYQLTLRNGYIDTWVVSAPTVTTPTFLSSTCPGS